MNQQPALTKTIYNDQWYYKFQYILSLKKGRRYLYCYNLVFSKTIVQNIYIFISKEQSVEYVAVYWER